MKLFKELGLVVLGALITLTIIFGLNFNIRLKNIEKFNERMITILQRQQPRQAIVPKPVEEK